MSNKFPSVDYCLWKSKYCSQIRRFHSLTFEIISYSHLYLERISGSLNIVGTTVGFGSMLFCYIDVLRPYCIQFFQRLSRCASAPWDKRVYSYVFPLLDYYSFFVVRYYYFLIHKKRIIIWQKCTEMLIPLDSIAPNNY